MIARALAATALLALLAACGGRPEIGRSVAHLDLPDNVAPVCGVPGLLGIEVGDIPGPGACGVDEAVRLYAVNGVEITGRPTVNCDAARALESWVETGARPAVKPLGARLHALKVVAHYACRRRNNQPRGKLSEHAKGNALDIAGLTLDDGRVLTVLGDWRDKETGPVMKKLHASACGPFGTVLGPKSDRFHQDHFHFDVAAYRSGPYCR